jgi:hypothetical protein
MKRTKLILSFIAVVLTVMVFVQACKKDKQVQLHGTHSIGLGEKIQISVNGNTVTLTASNFNDSRCPINALCVWAGVATGSFTFKDSSKEQTVELCLGACEVVSKPKKQAIILNETNYTVELTEFTPYPGTTKENIKATIVLTKM